MKIAVIHSYYSSRQVSGENVVVDTQIKALRDAGNEVLALARRTDDLEGNRGYQMRAGASVATGVGPSPILELEEFAPDVVHIHNLFPNWGTRWLQEWHGPIVATMHNFRSVCAAGTLFRDGQVCTQCPDGTSISSLRFACYRGSRFATLPLTIRSRGGAGRDHVLARADRIVTLSPRSRDLFAKFGIEHELMAVIPNFVDSTHFSPEKPIGAEWAYIGRLSPEKGIQRLMAEWPSSEILSIYGDGELRANVEHASGQSRGIRYRGAIPQKDVAKVLAQSRGLIFPSEWAEGFPTVYAEALAAGRPVIAREGNSAADDVEKSKTGATYKDSEGLRLALSMSHDELSLLGRIARAHFDASYTKHAWLQAVHEVYNETIRQTRSR